MASGSYGEVSVQCFLVQDIISIIWPIEQVTMSQTMEVKQSFLVYTGVEFGLVMSTTTLTLFTQTYSTADNINLKDVEKNITVFVTFGLTGADGRCVDTILCG